MTKKDYKMLAKVLGGAFAKAERSENANDARMFVYDAIYTPLVAQLALDNPLFSMVDFSYACAVAEGNAREAIS